MNGAIPGMVAGTLIGAGAGVAFDLMTRPDTPDRPDDAADQWLDAYRARTSDERRADERRDARVERDLDRYVREHPMPGGGEVSRLPARWVETYDRPRDRSWYVPTLLFGGFGGVLGSLVPFGVLERTNSERLSTHGLRGAVAFGALLVTPAFIAASIASNAMIDRG